MRGNAALQVLGGALLALAKAQFHKNLAMIAGLLFAALDRP